MRKFLIKVSGEQYEVEVEEVAKGQVVPKAAPAPSPVSAKSVSNTPSSPCASGICRVDSPMPGNVLKINVKIGDLVKKGQTVFFLEAMKMENEIGSPSDGKVIDIQAKVGDTVEAGQPIVILE